MDLKKQIKLSDLVRRSATAKKAGAAKALRGEVVGLKIGASQLAASRVANNGSARLLQLARGPLPSGIVVSGEVRDIPALAAALDEFFRTHKLPRRGVRLGVATNRIGVRSFELAGIDDELQLENAIRFRAHEALSIPVDDAVLDYHVVSETLDDSGRTVRRVVLAAAYRDSIDRYVAACKQAGVEVVAVDLEAFALLRTVAPPLAGDAPAAVVAVTIGHDRTTLAISDGTVCDFTRVLEWGGSSLVAAIERELGVDASEAAELKQALSLETAGTLGAGADERKSARAREAVRRELQTLARDLVNSLQFYQTQPGSLAISEILLAGGTSRLNGLPEELERLTQVRVRRADPLARVQVADSVGSRDDLAVARRGHRTGNRGLDAPRQSLPAPRVETRQDDGQSHARTTTAGAIAAGLMVAFVTAAVGFAFVQERSAVNDRQSTLDGLQAKVAQTHAASRHPRRPSLRRRRGTSPRSRRPRPGGWRGTVCSTSSRASCLPGPRSRPSRRTMAPARPRRRRRVDAVDLDDDVEQPRLEVVVLDERHAPRRRARRPPASSSPAPRVRRRRWRARSTGWRSSRRSPT